MVVEDFIETCSYVLPHCQGRPGSAKPAGEAALCPSRPFLVENVLWFCRLRWLAVAILGTLGGLDLLPDLAARLGLLAPGRWPFLAAGVLTIGNMLFLRHVGQGADLSVQGIMVNLWCQITLDLLVLTAVVHFVGSRQTYIAFTYLFHIVLTCVFFSRRQSLAVVGMASVLYAACLSAEQAGIISSSGILAGSIGVAPATGAGFLLGLVSVVSIWVVVWYLVSHLSRLVWEREAELARANRHLEAAHRERCRHMLTTTHQLKAPFAAVHANTQILLGGHCGALPEEARQVVERIAARCRRLAGEIQEMLQLANLNSDGQQPPPPVELNLAEQLRWCIGQVEPIARERGTVFEAELQPVRTLGVEDHLRMMFINLLANAVMYSHPGGTVRVECRRSGGENVVAISDQGIGIAAEKLPRIFEEYYRTKEAVQHNKESSGLGLAIVRQVAQMHGIDVRVHSRPGKGTRFELRAFPAVVAGEDVQDKGDSQWRS